MKDPGRKLITVDLMGEKLELLLTRRGLRRAEYESRTPLFSDSHFWDQLGSGIQPFQLVVLMYAALAHLNRFTFAQVDEAMDLEHIAEHAAALTACLVRDFPPPKPSEEDPEIAENPSETQTITG
mgnify:CR=1 FL=1